MKIKALLAGIVLATGSTVALADAFNVDAGLDFGDNARNKADGAFSTTTGWLDQASYNYQSTTIVTDDSGPAGPGVGDTIHTTGGYMQAGGLGANAVNGFLPNAFGLESHNGYGTWGLTFDFELDGTFGPNFETNYTSGFVTFYYFEGLGPLTELFTLDYKSITQSPGGPSLKFQLDSVGAGVNDNGVAAGDVFNFGGGFGSMTDLLASGTDTFAFVDFNTDPLSTGDFTNLGGGMYSVFGDHDGSISFRIPEPASIAILGLGLLGLAGASRRRKS